MKLVWFSGKALLPFAGALAICVLTATIGEAQSYSAGDCACPGDCAMPGVPMEGQEGLPQTQEPPIADLAEEQFASLGGETISLAQSNVGYIDSAPIATQFRMRFDAAYNMNRADRAEYYYTTWTNFGGEAPVPRVMPDPDVDFQLITPYFEHAICDRFSLFIKTPVLFNNPSLTASHAGLGDIQAGFKWGLSNCCDRQLTFQLNNYFPTGDGESWLSAGHYSIEPGLLYFRQWTDRVTLEAELKDWISIDGAVNPENGEPYAGNVLQYGIGLGYDWRKCGCWTITPVVEFVGWTVLEGQVFEFNRQPRPGPVDAASDTIVNVKLGARLTECGGGSIYGGYGRSLTGDRWYEDIVRLEYRRPF